LWKPWRRGTGTKMTIDLRPCPTSIYRRILVSASNALVNNFSAGSQCPTPLPILTLSMSSMPSDHERHCVCDFHLLLDFCDVLVDIDIDDRFASTRLILQRFLELPRPGWEPVFILPRVRRQRSMVGEQCACRECSSRGRRAHSRSESRPHSAFAWRHCWGRSCSGLEKT